MKLNYVPREQRKKILLICDDIRMTSGVSTVAREMIIGTSHHFNWVNVGGAIKHPDIGKKLDLNEATNEAAGIKDASVYIYPVDGYGNGDILRQLLKSENPDAIMFFTDPRYFVWLFHMEHEIRQKIPMIYLNIWDDLPYPMYNKSFYESCDTLIAISKQTENINRVVLGDKANEKIIQYIPHGINENMFYPITSDKPEWLALDKFKNDIFGEKEYSFNLLYNARNIRRKCVPDLILAWKIFIDQLNEEEAKKCNLILHTQAIDENGTNLLAVADMIYGNNSKYNVIFSESKFPVQMMNMLYNICDATVLPSSNEGWGLSLTESMMCGKPIIANVTGGMQDQMRFEDENGEWIKFTEQFGSNHRGKYKKCGEWAIPVFPSNISLLGSVPTPYIYDDRISPEDLATAINSMYDRKINWPKSYERMCEKSREWVTSDEAQMTASNMCNNIINTIDKTLDTFEPRYRWELIEAETLKYPKHFVKYPIAC
jgi:glycosyltransferase involved in cell wall biosynthesis